MGRVRCAPVAMQGDGHLGDSSAAQTGFNNHLRGEFHTRATLIKSFVHGFGKTAQTAVNVVNRRVEPLARKKGENRIANPAMQKRHRAGLNRTTTSGKPAPLDQIESFSQFFYNLRELKKIIAV